MGAPVSGTQSGAQRGAQSGAQSSRARRAERGPLVQAVLVHTPLRLLIRHAARRIESALVQAAVAAVAGKEKLAFTMDSAAAVVRFDQCSAV